MLGVALLALLAGSAQSRLVLSEVQLVTKTNTTVAKSNATLNATDGVWLLRPLGDKDVHADWDYEPFQDPEVVKKYTDAEAVQQTLFVMACNAKHKTDVDGLARAKAKKEAFTEKEFAAYVKKLQDGNIAEMKKRCGGINTKSWQACRQTCTDNWANGGAHSLAQEKQRCIDRCEKKHSDWESTCMLKVDELANVFISEQGGLANTKKCVEIHCKAFPEVLMMDESEGEERKKEGCKESCTDKAIEARCSQSWDLNIDTQLATWEADCHDDSKSGTFDPCMDDGTGKADENHDTCKTDGESKCGTEHDDCIAEGEKAGKDSMVGANAESICGVRKNVCISQVVAKCKKDHSADLDESSKKCKEEHKAESKSCLNDKIKEEEKTFKDECKADLKPTCKDDCEEDCQLADMNKCKDDMIKHSFGLTAEYCTGLWQWIFDSEFHDKKNMDPIPKADTYRFEKLSRKKLP